MWKALNLPVLEEELAVRFFCAIYDANPQAKSKLKLFIGKCTHQFLNDLDGDTVSLELDCLDLAIGSLVILQEWPAHLGSDVGFFPAWNIIAGSLQAKYLSGTKWEITEYPNLVKAYNVVKKLNREETQKCVYD